MFLLIVQFIPLHFKPDKESEIHQVEKDNDLLDGFLLHIRWIKPAHKRVHDQTCSHIILVTSAADTANKILTNSLVICQKCIYAEKCKKEPTCCLKCQEWATYPMTRAQHEYKYSHNITHHISEHYTPPVHHYLLH